jgi:carbamoyltransferase
MNILGISALFHDSAACLVRDGEIVAAAQEERFTRRKHDAAFPHQAIAYCRREAGSATLDCVAFYEKPLLKADRLFSSYLAVAPRGLSSFLEAMPLWLNEKLWIKPLLREALKFDGPIIFPQHHQAHAASAFFPSRFDEAAILTVDGVGEWTTTSVGRGHGNRVELLQETRFPHSLGLLYSAVTYYLGFRVNSGESKVMGLAPYGKPRFRDVILHELINLREDGSFRLNLRHFDFVATTTMTARSFEQLFEGPRREPETELTQRHMDIAHSIQVVLEEAMLRMARYAHELTGARNLCLAGGVALNCVANGRILREAAFDDIWIQPAAGDAGGAIGAAMLAWHHYFDEPRSSMGGHDAQKGSLLGPQHDGREFLRQHGIPHIELKEQELSERVATLLADGKVVGWVQDRMEFGPRSLGNRSILADPQAIATRETLNRKIKFRESFRPFAPAILVERVSDYVELDRPSPYMLLVAPVKANVSPGRDIPPATIAQRLRSVSSSIPAVTHVDGSARVQTVDARDNARLHRLLRDFESRTGCGVLVNTSFNVRGEPPVCTPIDAYRCFMRTELDYLVLGNCLLDKQGQRATTLGAVVKQTDLVSEKNKDLGTSGRALRLVFGSIISKLILTLIYFLMVTPLGLGRRAIGSNPFELAFRPPTRSYWRTPTRSDTIADYEKQF